MWVIYLEMGLALALLILIVWWTWPAKREGAKPGGKESLRGRGQDGERR